MLSRKTRFILKKITIHSLSGLAKLVATTSCTFTMPTATSLHNSQPEPGLLPNFWVIMATIRLFSLELWKVRLQKNIYSVNTKTGKITRISPDNGTHTAQISQSGNYIIDAYSNTTTSLEYKLLEQPGKGNQDNSGRQQPAERLQIGRDVHFQITGR